MWLRRAPSGGAGQDGGFRMIVWAGCGYSWVVGYGAIKIFSPVPRNWEFQQTCHCGFLHFWIEIFLATKEEEMCSCHMYLLNYVLDLNVQVDVMCTSQTLKGKWFKLKCLLETVRWHSQAEVPWVRETLEMDEDHGSTQPFMRAVPTQPRW